VKGAKRPFHLSAFCGFDNVGVNNTLIARRTRIDYSVHPAARMSCYTRRNIYLQSIPYMSPTFTQQNVREVSSSATNNQSPSHETIQFLLSLGYSQAVSNGIIKALLQSGIPSSSLFSMVKGLAGRYEVGEDGGLVALAASVKAELEREEGKATVKIWCLPSTGWSPANDDDANEMPTVHSMERAFAVEALEGLSLTDLANHGTGENCDILGEYLECACSGIMACSTCHVVIHPDWYDTRSEHDLKKIGPPSEAELDMIDLAYEPQLTSRLGCQIVLTKELNGLVVLLPAESNNLMDFVPFE
jgi:2Fe-2S ferredoxin